MKRIVSLLLSITLLLSMLTACQGPAAESDPPVSPSAADSELTTKEIVDAVFLSCGYDGTADVEYLTADEGEDGFLAVYLENAYGLTAGTWEDAAVIRATGASAFELAVLRLEDERAAVQAAAKLMTYIFNRQGDFAGYAPAEADMVARGSINQDGPYAALFICPDTDSADAAFTAALSGTSQLEPASELETDVGAILDCLLEVCEDVPEDLERLDGSRPEDLAAYIGSAYGLTRDQWEEAAIARGMNDSVFELAVLQLAEAGTAYTVSKMLNQGYLNVKEEAYARFPDQAGLLSGAFAAYPYPDDSGLIILAVCSKPMVAMAKVFELIGSSGLSYAPRHDDDETNQDAFSDLDPAYPDRIKFVQPGKDDMSLYDTAAIRAAWETGDPSSLSDYDKDIYDAAKKVLDKVLKDGMSDLEKETAVYSWVVNNVNYDWTHQNILASTPRESFTPYGGLVNHTAVCLGYAATFQLLCDLAGVECITVVGAAFASQEDHGWNMVRLDGNWYCVDVTWDANYREYGATRGREQDWDYFNITSDEMAGSDHQWDYANTPEAVTEGNGSVK